MKQNTTSIPLADQMVRQGNWLFARRGYLPIFLLLSGLCTLYLTYDVETSGGSERWKFWLGMGLSAFGMMIRFYTVGYTADNSSGRNVEHQMAASINTSGIYSMVRHPLYLGNFFIYLGIALFTGYLPFIVLFTFVFVLYYERIMCAEEKYLADRFGPEYNRWAAKTAAFLPSKKNYQPNSSRFNWYKSMEREKSGVLSFFIVVFVFEVVRCYAMGGNYWNECGWAFIVGWLATAYYFFFKLWSPGKSLKMAP